MADKKNKKTSTSKQGTSKKGQQSTANAGPVPKVGKLQFNADKLVSCVHLRFYAEQVGFSAGTSMAGPAQDKALQIKFLTDFLVKLSGAAHPFYFAGIIHDSDTVLGKADSESDFWVPSIEKPHCHLIIWYDLDSPSKRPCLRTVLNYLKQFGFAYRSGNKDDFELIKKGIKFPNKRKREHIKMFVYLTHETYEAQQEGKHQYSRDLIYTNLTDAKRTDFYNIYEKFLTNQRMTAEFKESVIDMAFERGRKGLAFDELWYDRDNIDPIYAQDRTLKANAQDAYTRGVEKFLTDSQAQPHFRCCIFINGLGGLGKTRTSKMALEALGRKIYGIEGGKTGKTDGLDSTYDAIVCDDTTLPDLHGMADQAVMAVYKRNSGRPIWAGDYLIMTYNGSFKSYLNEMGYSALNPTSKEALSTRFFHCTVDDKTRKLIPLRSQTRVPDRESAAKLTKMFMDFYNQYNAIAEAYAGSDLIDPMQMLMDELAKQGDQLTKLPREYFDYSN